MIELDISWLDDFAPDIIIDARSPREFSHSHIPNAKNFFALNDDEYEEVGTIYKQRSKSHAKFLGASYVCKNASKHLEKLEKSLKVGSKIAIYCARGGMRSNSLGTIFDGVDYRVAKIKGGYKSYRNDVLEFLKSDIDLRFITLFGNTGCGKTELIQSLNPSLDLERLANHLGSSFGRVNGAQPTTKSFQNNLVSELKRVLPSGVCFVEGESKRIGELILPTKLYDKMGEGVGVHVVSSMEFRVKRIVKIYQHISREYFYECIKRISPYIKKSAKEEIVKSYEELNFFQVALLLLENYYDKVYKKPRKIDYTVKHDGNSKETLMQLRRIYEQVL